MSGENPEIKEAHAMLLDFAEDFSDLINEELLWTENYSKQRGPQPKIIEVNGCRQSLALIIMDGDLIGADVSVEKSLKQRKNTGGITRINTFYFQKKYEQPKSRRCENN